VAEEKLRCRKHFSQNHFAPMQVDMEDVVVGQYRGRQAGNRRLPGYLEDKTVPAGRCGPGGAGDVIRTS